MCPTEVKPSGVIALRSDLRKVAPQMNATKTGNKSQRKMLTIASWNVRTLLDNTTETHAPEKTAFVAKELEHSSKLYLLLERILRGAKRERGIGSGLHDNVFHYMLSPPKCLSDRLMAS